MENKSEAEACHAGVVMYRCQNCRKVWNSHQLKEIEDLLQRVGPGEIMPYGECPACGAVCHEVVEPLTADTQRLMASEMMSHLAGARELEQLRLLQGQLDQLVAALDPQARIRIPEPVLTELLEIARRALADGDFFDDVAKSCDLSDDYMCSLRDALDDYMASEGLVNHLAGLNKPRIPCADCSIPIPDPGEDCREPEAFLCDTCLKKAQPEEAPPTCILTGAPGEDPDDCTTHEHEKPAL